MSKYTTQNDKIWTINFSNKRFVQTAKELFPALKNTVNLKSIGLTILLAVEFCLQDQVINDFNKFVNARRRGLL